MRYVPQGGAGVRDRGSKRSRLDLQTMQGRSNPAERMDRPQAEDRIERFIRGSTIAPESGSAIEPEALLQIARERALRHPLNLHSQMRLRFSGGMCSPGDRGAGRAASDCRADWGG